MRTQEEILKKIEEKRNEDMFGVFRSHLVDRLDFENAKNFLKEGATEDQWKDAREPNTPEAIKKEMREYLPFAFEKAEDQRGLSAGRSMDHYAAWIWLLDEESHFGDVTDYDSYGLPHLKKIKEFLEK